VRAFYFVICFCLLGEWDSEDFHAKSNGDPGSTVVPCGWCWVNVSVWEGVSLRDVKGSKWSLVGGRAVTIGVRDRCIGSTK